ncbi:hypothetical protein GUJ93_ZPchr0012g21702 [Zizania palustris]|uniref:Uncharacterized protein n=1 Tax=Zizania palustris TaxID=103762 RepID=A0A8J6BSR9_ZIZPA|nr:hypothetical protein GUJ93_ZPchr0012g21702 [Zizania palustris]
MRSRLLARRHGVDGLLRCCSIPPELLPLRGLPGLFARSVGRRAGSEWRRGWTNLLPPASISVPIELKKDGVHR